MNAVESVGACLAQIKARDGEIRAWAHVDAEAALARARALDRSAAAGAPPGPLHGTPVGVKDVIDTADMPTQYGSALYKGRTAAADAEAVRRLRAAGAVILGKTVTAELAVLHPGETRNPHDLSRTPGGSSSGSAAAVAAGMAAGALGTQTNGSVIRPAAFCGVVGYKPGFGLIPRTGVLTNSRALDTLGVFARTVADAARLAEAVMGAHEGDPDTRNAAVPALCAAAAAPLPAPPRLAFAETPVWERAEPAAREAFAGPRARLAEHITEAPLPEACGGALECHAAIMDADVARAMCGDYSARPGGLSPVLRAMIERGQNVSAADYARALAFKAGLTEAVVRSVFAEADAVITPAAAGEAPLDHAAGTGDPAFCTLWQLCGLPAVSLPLLRGPNGLPIGVQLAGPPGGDARLIQTAAWMMRTLKAA